MTETKIEPLPDFLISDGNLKDYFDSQLRDLTSKEKGDYFAKFTRGIIPLSDIGSHFGEPTLR
ncbi:hypothetical protein [Coleofasciculus sp. FACHB-SPT9]|uniref:hypothetical protein n=1 Tax=Cyanophyceae TaxID=3028117 RepID=UPI001686D8D6|nr:hypothetical protein [Coleofasciculus sp. FACHB-SPT9]MBD1891518.1 hypothetical protein [Coleofasciculus sp. FACHB-SPT9]